MIVSTTLTGSDAGIIGDALASVVDHVDCCLVIDTGARDETIDVARRVAGAKLLLREYAWTNDFAAARNFSLDAAEQAGGAWALTIDTDERLVVDPGVDLRTELARSSAHILLVNHVDGFYAKERIVRLPPVARWSGPTHEGLVAHRAGQSALLAGVWFSELGKDPEATRRKFERDATLLRAHTRRHPSEPRWHYYLGTSLQGLEHYTEAIEAYRACTRLGGWPEEGAWACYKAAECFCALERWDEAVEMCASGLAIRPATAELAWLAGWASYQAKRYEDAIAWSRMAIANGLYAGAGATYGRFSFRYPTGLYEGPYDVLRWAFTALGDHKAAGDALREWAAAEQARLRAAGT